MAEAAKLMAGKRGVVFGVANNRSIAWGITKACRDQGAEIALTYQGELVDPAAIRKTFLLTVEGERDDICAMGQTMAAHDLCSGLRPYMKSHHLQPGVGHYGVFSGRKWDGQIYPIVRNLILAGD